jgi:hypothetical protein
MSILKLNKKFWLGGLAVFALVFTGCLTDDKKSDSKTAPKITAQPINDTVSLGGTATFTITATGSDTLTYLWLSDIDTLGTTATLTLSSVGVLDDGRLIKCVVSNSVGSVTSNTVTLHVNVPWPAEQTLAVGAQGNPTLGTAVDLDLAAVLTTAQVNLNSYAALPSVDILFAFSVGTLQIMTPAAAKDAGDVPLAVNYPDANITLTDFIPVTAKPASQIAAEEAYMAATMKYTSADVAAGDMFVVLTSDGNYAYVKVDSITGSGNTAATNLVVTVSSL